MATSQEFVTQLKLSRACHSQSFGGAYGLAFAPTLNYISPLSHGEACRIGAGVYLQKLLPVEDANFGSNPLSPTLANSSSLMERTCDSDSEIQIMGSRPCPWIPAHQPQHLPKSPPPPPLRIQSSAASEHTGIVNNGPKAIRVAFAACESPLRPQRTFCQRESIHSTCDLPSPVKSLGDTTGSGKQPPVAVRVDVQAQIQSMFNLPEETCVDVGFWSSCKTGSSKEKKRVAGSR